MSDAKKELQAKLAKLRAEREARASEREAVAELRELADQVEDEERVAKLEIALAEAESKHGPLGRGVAVVDAVYADGKVLGSVIVKRPHPAVFKRFRDNVSDKGKQVEAELEKFWRPSLVWPDAATVDRYLEELPATQMKLADACGTLAGSRDAEVSGKS